MACSVPKATAPSLRSGSSSAEPYQLLLGRSAGPIHDRSLGTAAGLPRHSQLHISIEVVGPFRSSISSAALASVPGRHFPSHRANCGRLAGSLSVPHAWSIAKPHPHNGDPSTKRQGSRRPHVHGRQIESKVELEIAAS
jgi:hypothetical protein